MIAEAVYTMGRCHLRVCGFYLATEGDKCRDGNLPEDVFEPISREELALATIGGKPASEFPINIIRFFRGDVWSEQMIHYVADQINKRVAELTT